MTTPTGMQNTLSIAERRALRAQEQEAKLAKEAADRKRAELEAQGISGGYESPRMILSKIIRNPENPRDELTEVEDLAASIREVGVTTAITLIASETFAAAYPEHASLVAGTPYVAVNGNRRHRASELAGEEDIPFTVNTRATTREDIATIALVENIQRVDLTPMEEARTVADLLAVYKRNVRVAERLGKSEGWVSQRLKLVNLTPEFQAEVEAGKLLVEDARVLGRKPKEEQPEARERLRVERQQKAAQKATRTPRKKTTQADSEQKQQAPAIPVQTPTTQPLPTPPAENKSDQGSLESAASAGRQAACRLAVGAGDEGDDVTPVLLAAMLNPAASEQARVLAQSWLDGQEGSPTATDFAIVLSGSDYTPRRTTAALALALAHCEIHAMSQARDESVRAYVRWLAKHAGYSPAAHERDLLAATAATA
ncbi:ParB/RepB/Spo0J family partition protein [Streptomyces virginiae]|uniref:ParB/RepB/Spo0J family partition protein n=1 Tax=Streptomyces virginiae TaxID=1961 RepID=UPI0036563898